MSDLNPRFRRQRADHPWAGLTGHTSLWAPGGVLAPWTCNASPLPCGAVFRSLEAISGLESNSRVFTAQVQGLLQLQVRLGLV